MGFPTFKSTAADLQHIGSQIVIYSIEYRHTICNKLRTGRPRTECDSHIELDPPEQTRRSSGEIDLNDGKRKGSAPICT